MPDRGETKRIHPDPAELTCHNVEARYPGDWPEATVGDAARAMAQAAWFTEQSLRVIPPSSPRIQPMGIGVTGHAFDEGTVHATCDGIPVSFVE